MSDANHSRKPQGAPKPNAGEKKDASFAKFILNFLIYFGLGFLLLTALGLGR